MRERGEGAVTRRIFTLVTVFRNGARMTISEAAERLKIDPETARKQVSLMHDSGLIRVCEYKSCHGPLVRVFGWADEFGADDAPLPRKQA